MADILDQIRVWVEAIINSLGYVGIAFVMFVENIFPPIPSEVVMPFAGFSVLSGRFTFVGVVAAGTLGSVLGAVVLYYIGFWANEPIIRNFIRRFGWLFLLSEDDLDRALGFFERYSQPVVFFGRLIPLVRSLISIPAGMHHMPMWRFLIFTTLGSAIWSGLLAYAGLVLAENWQNILEIIDRYQALTLAAIALGVAVFVVLRVRSRMAKARLKSKPSSEV